MLSSKNISNSNTGSSNTPLLEDHYTKQVIIIRKDLKMRRGKEIAQGAHAAIGAYLLTSPEAILAWVRHGTTKICVTVESEEELEQTIAKAREAGLPCYLVTDSGRTEFKGQPTKTAGAIGPATVAELRPITGHLKLY